MQISIFYFNNFQAILSPLLLITKICAGNVFDFLRKLFEWLQILIAVLFWVVPARSSWFQVVLACPLKYQIHDVNISSIFAAFCNRIKMRVLKFPLSRCVICSEFQSRHFLKIVVYSRIFFPVAFCMYSLISLPQCIYRAV